MSKASVTRSGELELVDVSESIHACDLTYSSVKAVNISPRQ